MENVHGQFERSLKRGTKNQANANANKAQYLNWFLESNKVETLDALTTEQLITLNVNIAKVDQTKKEIFDFSASIGDMITRDREAGKYYGRD